MCIERIARNAGFAIAALAIVGSLLGFSLEYVPYVSALAHS
jgi:hypothetical protein